MVLVRKYVFHTFENMAFINEIVGSTLVGCLKHMLYEFVNTWIKHNSGTYAHLFSVHSKVIVTKKNLGTQKRN
jgi:hypothetical protein